MQKFNKEKIREILSKDMDKKSLDKAIEKIEENYKHSLNMFNIKSWEDSNIQDKVSALMALGLGRDRTINALSEFRINRDNIKEARNSMNQQQNEFRTKNESFITNAKIESTKRNRRLNEFKNANVKWETIAKKYLDGIAIHKIAKEHGVKVHTINEHLKDEGLHDETRSTLLKNKKAISLENVIDDNFIVELVNNNPLDSKDLWWEKAKEKYPWLLRKQMFDKLIELGLERSEEELNKLKGEKSKATKEIYFDNRKKILFVIDEIYGSIENLVEKYKDGLLGSYSNIAEEINKKNSIGFKITRKQVYRAINNKSFNNQKSAEQIELYETICKLFPKEEILEEVIFGEHKRRVDIYIPELNLAIDYNGEYWHSNVIIESKYKASAFSYHKGRVEDLKDDNVKLIYVWENDWIENRKEIVNLLKRKDWESPIFNKYEGDMEISPNNNHYKQVIKDRMKKMLKDSGLKFKVEGNTFTLLDD